MTQNRTCHPELVSGSIKNNRIAANSQLKNNSRDTKCMLLTSHVLRLAFYVSRFTFGIWDLLFGISCLSFSPPVAVKRFFFIFIPASIVIGNCYIYKQ